MMFSPNIFIPLHEAQLHFAPNRKVAGSIPDGVIETFHWHNPSDRTMALGSTQPLTEMSTRRISWGKCGRCVRLTTLPPPCAVVMKSGNLNFLEPSGPLQACNGTDLPLSCRLAISIKYCKCNFMSETQCSRFSIFKSVISCNCSSISHEHNCLEPASSVRAALE